MGNEATFGGLLRATFALIGDTRREFALYTVVLGALTALGAALGLVDNPAESLDYGFAVGGGETPAEALFQLLSAIASVYGTYWLLTRFLAARGRLQPGPGRFWAYLGCAILAVLGCIAGLILLIVPGIVLFVRWSAASGFVVGSRRGVVESLGASWDATAGHGWAIFFAGVALFFGILLASAIVGGIAGVLSGDLAGVVSGFAEAASGGVFAALGIAIFTLVHDDARQIGEVFA